jgi:hypothetical protein
MQHPKYVMNNSLGYEYYNAFKFLKLIEEKFTAT